MERNGHALFRKPRGESIPDYKNYVLDWLRHHPNGEIHIGCDSKKRGKRVKYSTVICLRNVGRGVSELYCNEIETAPPDDYSRLWNEVTRAVNVAEELKSLCKITVHVDINSNPKYRSHRLYDASIGLINSMGFEGVGKPLSWAATCGAHRHCQ